MECAAQKGRRSAQIADPNAALLGPPAAYTTCPLAAPNVNAPTDFQTISKVAETDGIHISAAIALNNSLAKPVALKLTLENHRKEDVFFDSSDYCFELFDEEGRPVRMTEFGRIRFGEAIMPTLNGGWKLLPGQAICRTYDLRDYFVIAHEGAYRLKVVRSVRGTSSYPRAGDELQVEVDSIVFNLTK
jgi:hypothetical protein